MKRLTSILAMNHEGIIGVKNALPWRLRTDLAFFKAQTSDAAVIMGRKTFDSLNGKPLPNRYNIVLSHNPYLGMDRSDLRYAYSISEGLYSADKYRSPKDECYIVGGATMYEQFAPYVERYLITLVDKAVEDGDTRLRLEMFGNPDDWEIVHHRAYPATPPADEVPFSIIELVSKRAVAVRRLRKETVESFRAGALRSSRSSSWNARKMAATSIPA